MDHLRLISTVFLVASLVSCAGVATEHSPTLFIISAICWTGCVLSGLASGFISGSPGVAWPLTAPKAKTAKQGVAEEGPATPDAELPPTLIVYSALLVFTVILQVGLNGMNQGLVFAGGLQAFATAFVFLRLRNALVFLVVLTAFEVVIALTAGRGVWMAALAAAMLALLLAPPTWRYAQRESLDLPAG